MESAPPLLCGDEAAGPSTEFSELTKGLAWQPRSGMTHFANGRHVAAARAMAGLIQVELAQLAGVHVNGIKRLERMDDRLGGMTAQRIGEALKKQGVLADAWPTPFVRIAG
jgi:DNA-binding XRE family transcriptional regulator